MSRTGKKKHSRLVSGFLEVYTPAGVAADMREVDGIVHNLKQFLASAGVPPSQQPKRFPGLRQFFDEWEAYKGEADSWFERGTRLAYQRVQSFKQRAQYWVRVVRSQLSAPGIPGAGKWEGMFQEPRAKRAGFSIPWWVLAGGGAAAALYVVFKMRER